MRFPRIIVVFGWCALVHWFDPLAKANEGAETVAEGASVTLTAEFDPAIGPFYYQWIKDGVTLPDARGPTLRFAPVQISDAGYYIVYVTNAGGTANSPPARLRVAPSQPSRISNLSLIAAGSPIILGFGLAEGTTALSTPFTLRAAGPALEQFGVTAFMRDPRLQLTKNGAALPEKAPGAILSPAPAVAEDTPEFTIAPGSQDLALGLTLSPGSYTALLSDSANDRGAGFLELFDLSAAGTLEHPRLTNLSARVQVAPDDPMIIAGFTISGTSSLRILARAVGPALAQFGVSSPLPDPTLSLHRGNTLIAANANGRESNIDLLTTTARQVGAFALPRDSNDAALVTVLAPGAYTLRLENPRNGSGTVLLELYEVP